MENDIRIYKNGQDDLECLIFLPVTSTVLDYRHIPPLLLYTVLWVKHRAWCMFSTYSRNSSTFPKLCLFFETGSHYVLSAELKFMLFHDLSKIIRCDGWSLRVSSDSSLLAFITIYRNLMPIGVIK